MADDPQVPDGADQTRGPAHRPRYGELAPEGWTWSPPPGDPYTRQPAPDAPTPPPAAAGSPRQGGAPAWDRPVTLGLLVAGVLGTLFAAGILGSLPEAIQMVYRQQGLGTYTPDPSVPTLITAGIVSLGVIWLAGVTVSVMLLMRGRRAFYVPLVAGVIQVILIFVFITLVLATDPTLLGVYGAP